MSFLDRFRFAKNQEGSATPKNAPASLYQEEAVSQLVGLLTRKTDLDEVLKKAGVKRHQLATLLSDDEIFQAVETRVDALLSVPFRLSPSEGDAADFLIEQLNKHIDVIARNAFDARLFGYAVQEAVYLQGDKYIGLNKIAKKPMQWFEPTSNGELYYFSDNGFNGLNGQLVNQEYKFFLTVNNGTYEQPQGTALLSRLYWPWFFRTNGWKFWAKFLERFGSPILVGSTGGDVNDMNNALLQAHGSAVISIDKEDSVSALAPSSATGQAFDLFENALVRRINKVILGQTLTSGTDGGGSRALGQVHENVRQDKRNSDIRLVLPTLQRVVDALCKLNEFEPHTITLSDGKGLEKERAERDKVLSEIGVEFTEQYFQDEYNLSAEHFKVKAPEQPATTFKALPNKSFSFAADVNQLSDEQQALDEIGDNQNLTLLNQKQIKDIVAGSRNPQELQANLFKLVGNVSDTQFNAVLDQALYAADTLGYAHASDGK